MLLNSNSDGVYKVLCNMQLTTTSFRRELLRLSSCISKVSKIFSSDNFKIFFLYSHKVSVAVSPIHIGKNNWDNATHFCLHWQFDGTFLTGENLTLLFERLHC